MGASRWGRPLWVRLHRWFGLVLAGVLTLAGLTGALLVWYHELDAWFAAPLHTASTSSLPSTTLDPLELRERVAAALPHADVHHVELAPLAPGRSVTFYLQGRVDPTTGKRAELTDDEVFVDPASGVIVGYRKWGDLSQGAVNLMPFIYRLHYSLAAGEIGVLIMGVMALAWTMDCFIGAFLTLPPASSRPVTSSSAALRTPRRGFWSRWRPAWRLRMGAGWTKFEFDWHRASGLWLWTLLFVLAWSSVAFNLREVYHPVMRAVFDFAPRADDVVLATSNTVGPPAPMLDWSQARARAQELMGAEAARAGLAVLAAQALSFDAQRALYRYTVVSSADIRARGSTHLFLDARTGALHSLWQPTGGAGGDTVTTWLMALHMGHVGGWPYRVLLCVVGLAVVALSVTGVALWWRRRSARRLRRRGPSHRTLAPSDKGMTGAPGTATVLRVTDRSSIHNRSVT